MKERRYTVSTPPDQSIMEGAGGEGSNQQGSNIEEVLIPEVTESTDPPNEMSAAEAFGEKEPQHPKTTGMLAVVKQDLLRDKMFLVQFFACIASIAFCLLCAGNSLYMLLDQWNENTISYSPKSVQGNYEQPGLLFLGNGIYLSSCTVTSIIGVKSGQGGNGTVVTPCQYETMAFDIDMASFNSYVDQLQQLPDWAKKNVINSLTESPSCLDVPEYSIDYHNYNYCSEMESQIAKDACECTALIPQCPYSVCTESPYSRYDACLNYTLCLNNTDLESLCTANQVAAVMDYFVNPILEEEHLGLEIVEFSVNLQGFVANQNAAPSSCNQFTNATMKQMCNCQGNIYYLDCDDDWAHCEQNSNGDYDGACNNYVDCQRESVDLLPWKNCPSSGSFLKSEFLDKVGADIALDNEVMSIQDIYNNPPIKSNCASCHACFEEGELQLLCMGISQGAIAGCSVTGGTGGFKNCLDSLDAVQKQYFAQGNWSIIEDLYINENHERDDVERMIDIVKKDLVFRKKSCGCEALKFDSDLCQCLLLVSMFCNMTAPVDDFITCMEEFIGYNDTDVWMCGTVYDAMRITFLPTGVGSTTQEGRDIIDTLLSDGIYDAALNYNVKVWLSAKKYIFLGNTPQRDLLNCSIAMTHCVATLCDGHLIDTATNQACQSFVSCITNATTALQYPVCGDLDGPIFEISGNATELGLKALRILDLNPSYVYPSLAPIPPVTTPSPVTSAPATAPPATNTAGAAPGGGGELEMPTASPEVDQAFCNSLSSFIDEVPVIKLYPITLVVVAGPTNWRSGETVSVELVVVAGDQGIWGLTVDSYRQMISKLEEANNGFEFSLLTHLILDHTWSLLGTIMRTRINFTKFIFKKEGKVEGVRMRHEAVFEKKKPTDSERLTISSFTWKDGVEMVGDSEKAQDAMVTIAKLGGAILMIERAVMTFKKIINTKINKLIAEYKKQKEEALDKTLPERTL